MVTKTQEDIIQIICKALDVSESQINLETIANDISEWDSLGQINIIIALDEALGGGLSEIEEMATAATIKEIIEVLRQRKKISEL